MGLVVNATLPAIYRGSGAMLGGAEKVGERIKTDISIVQFAPELDADGNWENAYGNGDANFDIFIWVKNVGASRIIAIDNCDIWFGKEGSISRITYGGADFPRWSYEVEGGGEWEPASTVKFTITYSLGVLSPLTSGSYRFKISTPNGIWKEYSYSVS